MIAAASSTWPRPSACPSSCASTSTSSVRLEYSKMSMRCEPASLTYAPSSNSPPVEAPAWLYRSTLRLSSTMSLLSEVPIAFSISMSAFRALSSDLILRASAARAAFSSSSRSYTVGGAPPTVYERLEEEKAALAAEARRIKSLESALNADIDMLNAIGTSLNKLIVELNLNVERYNKAGASTGGEFEEGAYVSEAGSQRIDIFEYSNRTELVRVLAHELGHALGLGHVEDAAAIMYKVNQSKRQSLAQDDITELNRVCSSGLF